MGLVRKQGLNGLLFRLQGHRGDSSEGDLIRKRLRRFKVCITDALNQTIGPLGTSLVVQRLSIRLIMKGTLVRFLVQEDPKCQGATKPTHHNYCVLALEPIHAP